MPLKAKPHWTTAFQRALGRVGTFQERMADSHQRVQRYRDHFDSRTSGSPSSRSSPSAEVEAHRPTVTAYRILILNDEGDIQRIETRLAHGDDEAMTIARSMVSTYAAELWDGLRFIEHFPSQRLAVSHS